MKLDIRLYLAELSVLNIIYIVEKSVVDRHRITVHRWVQKADLQSTDGAIRITSQSMKSWFSLIMSDTGCTPLSILTLTICFTSNISTGTNTIYLFLFKTL